jgi:hypothetical protein
MTDLATNNCTKKCSKLQVNQNIEEEMFSCLQIYFVITAGAGSCTARRLLQ